MLRDKSKIAVNVFDKRAVDYQTKFMDVSLYYDGLDIFCNSIKKQNAEILELACGPGNITKYLFQKRPDFKILATDLAPNMVALAKINNPKAIFELMDCRDLHQLNKTYDGIMCGFALPYLSREATIKMVSNAATMLNPNGLLYLSTMEGNYDQSGFRKSSDGKDDIYQYFYSATFLTDLLKANGLHTISFQRIEYDANGSKISDLILIGQKQN